MPFFARPIATSAHVTRAMTVAALMSATILAAPLAANAQATPPAASPASSQGTSQGTSPGTSQAPVQGMTQGAAPNASQAPSQTPAPAVRAQAQAETIEQRIASLHTQLQITPQQEPKWKAVAQTMRATAAEMQKMAQDSTAQASKGMTAVDDLKTYEKFARAHVAGLQKLTVSFEALYSSMPTAQKKVADQVFDNFGHGHDASAAHS